MSTAETRAGATEPALRAGRRVVSPRLWVQEARRAGPAALALPLLVAVGITALSLALSVSHAASPRSARLVMVLLLGDLFPVTAGLAAATVVGRERVLEMQLTVPTAYRLTVARRLAVLAAGVLVAAGGALAVVEADGQWAHPAQGAAAILVPIGAAALSLGAGAWAAVRLSSTAAASMVVLAVWLARLTILDRYLGQWQANRAVLLAAGLVFLTLAWRRLGDPERLLLDPVRNARVSANRRRSHARRDLRRRAAGPERARRGLAALPGTTFSGSLRYEMLMAARGRVLWLAVLPLLALAVFFDATSPSLSSVGSVSGRLAAWTVGINLFATLGIGVALADRFARTARPGLPDVLDATGARVGPRMLASLLGPLAVALAPVALAVLGLGGYVAVDRGDPAALGWSAAAFTAIVVPAALVTAAFAAAAGLLLPVPIARALVLLGWGWATILRSGLLPVPTLAGSVLSPLGDYAAAAWLDAPRFEPTAGALLSPPATAATALLSIAALLATATALFLIARLTRSHSH